MPSPEVSKEPTKSPKPTVCFNQLRGSQSLPDLSGKSEKAITTEQSVTMTPHQPQSLDNSESTSPQVIKPETPKSEALSTPKTEDISDEIVFKPISNEEVPEVADSVNLVVDGADDTHADIPEEILTSQNTHSSGLFHKVDHLKAVNVRSSGEEMMANMQSLLDVEESINIDDIEHDAHSEQSQLSESEENPDELWDSPDSSLAGTATITTQVGLDDFDKLEMKREKLELELGIELAVQAYKILSTTLDSTSVSDTVESKLRTLLGEHYDNYYPRLMQLVVQDSITYEQVA